MRSVQLTITAISFAVMANLAIAQEQSSFGVGLALGHSESIYRDMDDKSGALPYINYKNGNFFVRGLKTGYFFFGDESSVRIGALARLRADGYDAGDSDFMAGMEDRDHTVEGGLIATYPTRFGSFSMAALADLAGKHDGYELAVEWFKPVSLSQSWILTPEVGLSYNSANLNDYYYGVRTSEATAARAAYEADAGFSYNAGLSLTYLINQQHMLILGMTYKGYDSAVTDSSIVDKSSTFNTGLVYSYKF